MNASIAVVRVGLQPFPVTTGKSDEPLQASFVVAAMENCNRRHRQAGSSPDGCQKRVYSRL